MLMVLVWLDFLRITTVFQWFLLSMGLRVVGCLLHTCGLCVKDLRRRLTWCKEAIMYKPETRVYFTHEQNLSTLERMKARISESSSLQASDETTIGFKNTECSWGMCTADPSFWKKDE